jgi:hypothetical protein
MENNQIRISKWAELKEFFKDRIVTPLDHPEYILYFLIIVVGFGAISIWYTIYTESQKCVFSEGNLIISIASFAIAIMASGSIELMFAENKVIKTTLFLTTLGLIATGLILFFVCIRINHYFLAVLFALGALFIWWIANAENANLTKNFFVEQSEESEKLNNSLDQYDENA